MSDTWIIDSRHYLDERGRLLQLPTRVLNLALFQGSIVAWVTSRAGIGASAPTSTVAAAPDAAGAPERSRPRWFPPPTGSSGSARSVATTG